MSFTRAQLIDSIRKHAGISKDRSAVLIESVFEIIKKALESGEDVLISGFGKFCIKDRRDRRGRNPLTGEDLALEARRIVTFKCSPALKSRVNGNGIKA